MDSILNTILEWKLDLLLAPSSFPSTFTVMSRITEHGLDNSRNCGQCKGFPHGKFQGRDVSTHLSCYILREAVNFGRVGVRHRELHGGCNILRCQRFLQGLSVRPTGTVPKGTENELPDGKWVTRVHQHPSP